MSLTQSTRLHDPSAAKGRIALATLEQYQEAKTPAAQKKAIGYLAAHISNLKEDSERRQFIRTASDQLKDKFPAFIESIIKQLEPDIYKIIQSESNNITKEKAMMLVQQTNEKFAKGDQLNPTQKSDALKLGRLYTTAKQAKAAIQQIMYTKKNLSDASFQEFREMAELHFVKDSKKHKAFNADLDKAIAKQETEEKKKGHGNRVGPA